MAYDAKKKKLAFRVLASIFLIATIGFLFVPSIMITTTTTTASGTTKTSTRYSAASIVLGAFEDEDEKNVEKVNKEGKEGEQVALFMKTEGEKLEISDKNTTYMLAFFIVCTVVFAALGGVVNLISLFKIKPNWLRFVDSGVAFFIVATIICAIVSFAMSYFWVAGSYSANAGVELVRTNVKSYGYLGLLLNMVSPVLAFVFFHDRILKEE